MTANQSFRTALWAMLFSCGLMIVVAVPTSGITRGIGSFADRRSNEPRPPRQPQPSTSAAWGGRPHDAISRPVVHLSQRLEPAPAVLESKATTVRASEDAYPHKVAGTLRVPSAAFAMGPTIPQDGGDADSPQVARILRVPSAEPPPDVEMDSIHPETPAVRPLPANSTQLESQLVTLERKIERLAQTQLEQRNAALNDQVQDLERRLQQSQPRQPLRPSQESQQPPQSPSQTTPESGPSVIPPAPAAISPPALNSTDPFAPEETSSAEKPAPLPKPLLKIAPTEAGERFSLQIQDADISQVLEMLGQLSGLNILVGKDVKGKVTANLQEVNIDEALGAILRTHGFLFERQDRFIFVMTEAEQKARLQSARKIITKVYRPHYISVKDLQALVTPLLTPLIGKIAVTNPPEVGIATDAENAGGDRMTQRDALLVQDYPEVIQEIDGVIAEMDVPPMQVVIEAMILSVKLTDSLQFGINFALLSGKSKDLIVSGSGATLKGAMALPGSGTNSIVPAAGEFIADAAGLKYGFIRGDIGAFVSALETITDVNLIASPQLRVLNKQRGQIHIGSRLAFFTTSTTGQSIQQNTEFIDVGTKLNIRPFISSDGLVRMEVHPELSSGNIDARGLPDTQTTEVTTNVMVRDGTTVVIGGLIEEQVSETFQRVPLLGALPVVGHAFRTRDERVNRTELIVLITPRIVFEPEEAMAGEVIRDQSERRAEHFRANLSHVNRTNLTRLHYERAAMYFEQGELTRARYHIHQALKQSKNDLPALQLRDRIEAASRERNRGWLKFPFAPGVAKATSPPPEDSPK